MATKAALRPPFFGGGGSCGRLGAVLGLLGPLLGPKLGPTSGQVGQKMEPKTEHESKTALEAILQPSWAVFYIIVALIIKRCCFE